MPGTRRNKNGYVLATPAPQGRFTGSNRVEHTTVNLNIMTVWGLTLYSNFHRIAVQLRSWYEKKDGVFTQINAFCDGL